MNNPNLQNVQNFNFFKQIVCNLFSTFHAISCCYYEHIIIICTTLQKVELNKYSAQQIENLNVFTQMKTLEESSERMMNSHIHIVAVNDYRKQEDSLEQESICINYAWLNIIPAIMNEPLDFCLFIILSSKCFKFTFYCIVDVLDELLQHLL